MVEFRFDISPLFTQPIVKVTSNLLPHTFRGDRRQCLDATSKMSEIIDRLGQLSANAQKLNTPVTTAQRLRMSENQTIYLLADVDAGHNGAVIGLLKVGTKDLYLFDETGQTRKVENAPCILDFYIHESRQRAGLGKDLFETMLSDEKWTPIKCSVDRPSEKLLGFLKKHYGLVRSIPQANNFVLYEGFFDDGKEHQQPTHTNGGSGGMYITNSPNTQLFGATYLGDENNKRRSQRHLEASNVPTQITQISPVGRYGARRPTCSMAEKNASEVSLTPSQAAEQSKLNARKNPLDALSKTNVRQTTLERRSGLQDVDEEYLKQNVIRKPLFPRHSGLTDVYGSQQQTQVPSHAAGQPSIPQTESHQTNIMQSQAQYYHAQNQQQYQQSPQQLQQQQQASSINQTPTNVPIPPTAGAGVPTQRQGNHPINHSPQALQQQQQHVMPPQHHQQPPIQQQQQQQVPVQRQQIPMQQQQQVPVQQPQIHIQHNQMPNQQQMSNADSTLPEPEMCTTCPNCQTTIYLVRGSDVGSEMMAPPPPMAQHQQMPHETANSSGAGIPPSQTMSAAGGN